MRDNARVLKFNQGMDQRLTMHQNFYLLWR